MIGPYFVFACNEVAVSVILHVVFICAFQSGGSSVEFRDRLGSRGLADPRLVSKPEKDPFNYDNTVKGLNKWYKIGMYIRVHV